MTIFYSRNLKQAQKLAAYCKSNGIRLLAESLISFDAVDFSLSNKVFDVVFFTSPRSVDFFLAKAEIAGNQKVACIGTQTQKHLEKLGHSVAFFGANSTEPEEVALDFRFWLGEQSVLFPVSNQSNRSIPAVLNETQYEELVVYRTVEQPKIFDENPDVLIFSSPSNARAYLVGNTLAPNQKVACFGRTTHQFLQEHQIEAKILSAPTEEAVVAFLDSLESNDFNFSLDY